MSTFYYNWQYGFRIVDLIKMKSRVILTLGNSQLGKSSFINTLKGECIAEVGSYGVSQTAKVSTYDVGESKMLFQNDPSESRLIIIDVPGFQDSHLRIEDTEISELITLKLFELDKEYIDLVLLFESAISSSISIRQTLQASLSVFGEPIRSSIMIIVTKWDKLTVKEMAIKRAQYSKFTEFPLVEWINDTEDEKISNALKSSQLEMVSKSLDRIMPYRLTEINKLKEKCDILAIKIRNNDRDRYRIEKIYYKVKVPVTRVEKEMYTEYEECYKTEEEVIDRANQLRNDAGTHSVTKYRQVTESYQEAYTVVEKMPTQRSYTTHKRLLGLKIKSTTHYYTEWNDVVVTKYRTSYREVPQEYTDDEYYPIENYITQARNETQEVKKYRDKIINETEEETRCEEIKHEKHDIAYYKEKAKEEIVKNFRTLSRR